MSHFTVAVVGEDVEGQMARYDENRQVEPYRNYLSPEHYARMVEYYTKVAEEKGEPVPGVEEMLSRWLGDGEVGVDEQGAYNVTTYNPNSKWDWYSVGGRWMGALWKLKAGRTGALGESDAFDNEPGDGVDVCTVGDVDWEYMRAEAARKAREEWRKVHAVIGPHLPIVTWEETKRLLDVETHGDRIKMARAAYHAQDALKAVKEANLSEVWGFLGGPDDYLCTEDEYAERAADSAGVTYALVMNGEWYQQGRMGWFGISTGDMPQAEWNRFFHKTVAELPPDTRLTLLDCHI